MSAMNDKAPKNIWLIAGETSGEMYGARLATELKDLAAKEGRDLHISGMGGIKMRDAGVDILVDSSELDVIGILEVFKHIFTFIRIFKYLVNKAKTERPDAVVLIDYPGFNMMLAKALHKAGIPVIWYISPQVWAWKKYRIKQLEQYCRKMLVIFPFEVEVYQDTTLDTEFVGHPLLEMVEARRDPAIVRDPDTVVLLPGSRSVEINRLLKPMLETATQLKKRHPALKFVLTAPRENIAKRCQEIYNCFKQRNPDVPDVTILTGETAKYQQLAGTGLAASGTVTVESAIAGLPLVVVYRINWISLLIAAPFIKLFRGFFTMANVIADKMVFEEFLQHHVRKEELIPALERVLPGGERRSEVEQDMANIKKLLSPDNRTGVLKYTAGKIYETVNQNNR